jgi:hypothetical protein
VIGESPKGVSINDLLLTTHDCGTVAAMLREDRRSHNFAAYRQFGGSIIVFSSSKEFTPRL